MKSCKFGTAQNNYKVTTVLANQRVSGDGLFFRSFGHKCCCVSGKPIKTGCHETLSMLYGGFFLLTLTALRILVPL